jgi:hypothetical protein
VGLCNCICVCTVIRDTDRQHRFAERKCMIQRQTAQSRHAITAPHTTSLPPQNNRLTTNLNTHPINTSVQSQPTTDHTLNVLQNRKRAPLKHFRRWLINQTNTERPDEVVDFGSSEIVENQNIDSNHEWGSHQDDSED